MCHLGPQTKYQCIRTDCGQVSCTVPGKTVLCPAVEQRKVSNTAQPPGEPRLEEPCSDLSVARPDPTGTMIPDEWHCGMQLAMEQMGQDDGVDFMQKMNEFLMASIGYNPISPMVCGRDMSMEDLLYLNQIPGVDNLHIRGEVTLIAPFRYGDQRRRVFAQGRPALEAMLAEDAGRRLIIRNDIREHDEGRRSEANVMCRSHYCMKRR